MTDEPLAEQAQIFRRYYDDEVARTLFKPRAPIETKSQPLCNEHGKSNS